MPKFQRGGAADDIFTASLFHCAQDVGLGYDSIQSAGAGRSKLHYQPRHEEADTESDHDCPMMGKVVGK